MCQAVVRDQCVLVLVLQHTCRLHATSSAHVRHWNEYQYIHLVFMLPIKLLIDWGCSRTSLDQCMDLGEPRLHRKLIKEEALAV